MSDHIYSLRYRIEQGGMGPAAFFSSSKSSSSTSSNAEDNRVGAEGGSTAVGAGSTVNVHATDGEAWEFASGAIDFARDLSTSFASLATTAVENHTQDPADQMKSALLIGMFGVLVLFLFSRVFQ